MTTPQYRMMESAVDARAALGEVITAATRDLCVFDVKPTTLRDREFGGLDHVELIRAMLLAGRQHRVRIALHETTGIEGELPRVVALLRQFAGQLQIHRTVGIARDAQDVMVIADDHTIWRKPVATHTRSVFEGDDSIAVLPYLERFEEIWQSSERAVSDGALGL